MQLRSPVPSRTRQGARNWTVVIVAVLCLVCATNASAALSGTFNASSSQTGTVVVNPMPNPGPYTVGSAIDPSFCVGPPNLCGSGSGLFGTVDVNPNQIAFTFFGSTDNVNGSFTINLTNFTSPITGVSYSSGAFDSFVVSGFTASSISFTATTSSGFNAIGGQTITFDVAPVPEPSSIILLTTLVGGTMFFARRRLPGNRGTGA